MKRLVYICSLIFSLSMGAQNLVPNYSFENFSACPTQISQIWLAYFWAEPNQGSPDYFNPCATPPDASVPNNLFGSQNARTGNSYAGFWSFGGTQGSNVREYIQVQLTDSLIAGKEYCISFYVSRAGQTQYAISNLGTLFTTISPRFKK